MKERISDVRTITLDIDTTKDGLYAELKTAHEGLSFNGWYARETRIDHTVRDRAIVTITAGKSVKP